MKARALFLAGVAALLPVAMGGALADPPAQAAPVRFVPPSTPLILTRTTVRNLIDGEQIIVTRRYAIRFTPEGDGYRLDGEQIDASVEAPAILASLADLERKRVDLALFPARIDAHGMIRESSAETVDAASREAGLTESRRLISEAPMPSQTRRESLTYLQQVASVSAIAAWPAFLFNPGQNERVLRRKVPLPGSEEGEVEVRIQAFGLMPGGLPGKVERVITTHLAGSSRVSTETWTIARDPA